MHRCCSIGALESCERIVPLLHREFLPTNPAHPHTLPLDLVPKGKHDLPSPLSSLTAREQCESHLISNGTRYTAEAPNWEVSSASHCWKRNALNFGKR
jgi:hypothetical protein